MKNLKLIPVILSIFSTSFILSSCDPGTDYKKVVINQSNQKVTLLLDKNYNGYKMDTVIINEGSYYIVEASTQLGFSEDRYSNCGRGIPVYFINPISLTKIDISNSPKWIYEHKSKGRSHIVNCSYIIKNESF